MVWKDLLLMRGRFIDGGPGGRGWRRRRFVVAGAGAGGVCGLLARLWFRTLSDEHVFTVGGSLFIVIAFATVGSLAGLAFAMRRQGTRRRPAVMRLAALCPALLLGPGLVLFTPSVALAFALPRRRAWLRRTLEGVAALALVVLFLILLQRGPASPFLWLLLSYALFLSVRIAVEPRQRPAARYLLTA